MNCRSSWAANKRQFKNWAAVSGRDIWLKARRSAPKTCLWSMCNSSTSRNGVIAWGDRFSAKAADIPRIQRLIASRIAASLRVGMREAEKQEVLGRAPRDLGVYELTLRGAGKHRFNAEAARAAREDVEEAIRLDPTLCTRLDTTRLDQPDRSLDATHG